MPSRNVCERNINKGCGPNVPCPPIRTNASTKGSGRPAFVAEGALLERPLLCAQCVATLSRYPELVGNFVHAVLLLCPSRNRSISSGSLSSTSATAVRAPFVRGQEFVELGTDSLGIPMFGPLDQQRHAPDGQRCDTVPIQGFRAEDEPACSVDGDDQERGRMPRACLVWSGAV